MLTLGSVVDHAEGMVQRSALNQQLAVLPAKQRAVLVLDYYEGLTDPEIAEIVGCSPATVRVYRFRALGTLRSMLSPVSAVEDQ